MKALLNATAIALALAIPLPTEARETIFALSNAQPQADLKTQTERMLMHLFKTLEPGDHARFYDATEAELIATITVPDVAGKKSPKRTLNHNREAVAKLGAFVRGAQATPSHAARIDLPKLLRLLRATAPAPEDGADLIVLGHPLHAKPGAPSQSMTSGRIPSDGHIAATPGQSIYGTAGLPGTLAGYDVYFGVVGADWSISPSYSYHVTRFWSLLTEEHQASMAYIGSDLETIFAQAGQDAPLRRHAEPLRAEEKREMLTFAPDNGIVPELYTMPLEVAPAPETMWKDARGVTIGITWEVNRADLDLYVRPTPQSRVIFYAQSQTQEGRLFKDFTVSPGNGFETVALSRPMDLGQLKVAVNYYGGTQSTSGVAGELRIAIGDQVWAQRIHIPAPRGNGGAGADIALRDGVAPNDAWILIDPLEVIGVN